MSNDVTAELLALIGPPDQEALTTDEVNEILQRGVPLALKEQLKLITGPSSEKTKSWMIKEWLDRSGYTPVTKIAVAKKIQLDEKTLRVLQKIAGEDGSIDTDGEFCEAVIEAGQDGPGRDPTQPQVEGKEVALLLGEGDSGLCGPDSNVSPENVQVCPGPDDPKTAG